MLVLLMRVIRTASKRSRWRTKSQKHDFRLKPPSTAKRNNCVKKTSNYVANTLVLTQHVEPVDTEQSGVTLSTGEDIQRRMAEADVADHVGAFQQFGDLRRYDHRCQIVHECIQLVAARAQHIDRIQPDATESGKGFVLDGLPVADRGAVHVHGDRVRVGTQDPLYLVLTECLHEVHHRERAVLEKSRREFLFD